MNTGLTVLSEYSVFIYRGMPIHPFLDTNVMFLNYSQHRYIKKRVGAEHVTKENGRQVIFKPFCSYIDSVIEMYETPSPSHFCELLYVLHILEKAVFWKRLKKSIT